MRSGSYESLRANSRKTRELPSLYEKSEWEEIIMAKRLKTSVQSGNKNKLTKKQKNCSRSGEKRVEETGQGCGLGLICRDCDLLLETSPINIYY